ncbi:desulfoferrodoxin [Nanoarchaeota archaeon]
MTKLNEIYKCSVCGNIIEVLFVGGGKLVCCEKEMLLQEEKSSDEGQEKHVPVVEGNKVKVGSVPHPMEDEHYIQWVQVISKGKSYRKYLMPGDTPEVEFEIEIPDDALVREYCNLHGLWIKK